MSRSALAGLALLVAGIQTMPRIGLGANRSVRLTNERMQAVIQDGRLVGLQNRLTGEEYLRAGVTELLPFGIRYEGGEWAAVSGEPQLGPAGDDAVEYEFRTLQLKAETFLGLFRVRYSLEASGDLVVQVVCVSERPGVGQVDWTVNGIDPELNLILPVHSGVRVRRADELLLKSSFTWPFFWTAQLVVVESARGGFYILAEDAARRFKVLRVERNQEQHALAFGTQNFAPFGGHTRAQSVEWRINVFEGSWRIPARRHKRWMEGVYRVAEKQRHRPAWVDEINTAVSWTPIFPADPNRPLVTGPFPNNTITKALFDRFTRLVEPHKTILHIPAWRTDRYDEFYPRYEPSEDFSHFLEYARSKGFHVMPHFNYFAVSPGSEFYEKFSFFQLRDPFSGRLLGWHWFSERPDRLAYINPAFSGWQAELIGRVRAAVERLRLDAVLLDQTLININDANGLVEGISSIDGNLKLHDELAKALPGVVLVGEGLNEISFQRQSFAQAHSFPSTTRITPSVIAMSHPICSYLFSPYIRYFAYISEDENDKDNPLLAAELMRAIGGLPTFVGITEENARPETAQTILAGGRKP